MRFRRLLVAHGLDRSLFDAITRDLESKGACVRKGTLIDATIIGSAALAALGILAWQWPNMVDVYRGMRAPPAETARETPAPATRSKITDRIEPGTQSARFR